MKMFPGDKNYLAMLTVPVILFGIIGLSNDLQAETNSQEEKEEYMKN